MTKTIYKSTEPKKLQYTTDKYLEDLLLSIKEVELVYNLGPKLTSTKLRKVKKYMNQIVKS